MDVLENLEFKKKSFQLINLSKLPGKSVSLQYHGVPLEIRCKNKDFLFKLIDFFPSHWLQQGGAKIELILHDINDYQVCPFSFSGLTDYEEMIYKDDLYFHQDFVLQKDSDKHINAFLNLSLDLGPSGFFALVSNLIAPLLAEKNKLCLESSVVVDGRAHVFVGGASYQNQELYELCQGKTRLGDQYNLLSLEDNKLYVEASCFGKNSSQNLSRHEVSAFYFPKLSHSHNLHEIEQKKAKELMASSLSLFSSNYSKQKQNNIFKEIMSISSFFELDFCKNGRFWEYIHGKEVAKKIIALRSGEAVSTFLGL